MNLLIFHNPYEFFPYFFIVRSIVYEILRNELNKNKFYITLKNFPGDSISDFIVEVLIFFDSSILNIIRKF